MKTEVSEGEIAAQSEVQPAYLYSQAGCFRVGVSSHPPWLAFATIP